MRKHDKIRQDLYVVALNWITQKRTYCCMQRFNIFRDNKFFGRDDRTMIQWRWNLFRLGSRGGSIRRFRGFPSSSSGSFWRLCCWGLKKIWKNATMINKTLQAMKALAITLLNHVLHHVLKFWWIFLWLQCLRTRVGKYTLTKTYLWWKAEF